MAQQQTCLLFGSAVEEFRVTENKPGAVCTLFLSFSAFLAFFFQALFQAAVVEKPGSRRALKGLNEALV